MQEWRKHDSKGVDKTEAEEDLEKVREIWFATIAEDQDTMPVIALTQPVHHASIAHCLVMKEKTALLW